MFHAFYPNQKQTLHKNGLHPLRCIRIQFLNFNIRNFIHNMKLKAIVYINCKLKLNVLNWKQNMHNFEIQFYIFEIKKQGNCISLINNLISTYQFGLHLKLSDNISPLTCSYCEYVFPPLTLCALVNSAYFFLKFPNKLNSCCLVQTFSVKISV